MCPGFPYYQLPNKAIDAVREIVIAGEQNPPHVRTMFPLVSVQRFGQIGGPDTMVRRHT